MNCESKIWRMYKQLTVFMSYQSVRKKTVLAFFFFSFASYLLVVVILGWITSRFKSPLKLNMYTVCIK